MQVPIWAWGVFLVFIFSVLAIDLGLFHKKDHVVKMKEALSWTAVWVTLAFIFAAIVNAWMGRTAAMEFIAGYLIEYSLSVDNIFVFILIFKYFRTPAIYQHRVLFWGILGAVVLRAVFILAGIALINKFHWTIYVFGVFLVFTGVKLFFEDEKEIDPEKNLVLRLLRKFVRMTSEYDGHKFFTIKDGVRVATPLFAVLVVVETSDVIFAVDSIPAILAITKDPFIVFTSNIFAILGLRSLFFALSGLMDIFHFLHYGLAFILMFVGGKMLMSGWYKLPISVSLGVIAGILLLSVLFSIPNARRVLAQRREEEALARDKLVQ